MDQVVLNNLSIHMYSIAQFHFSPQIFLIIERYPQDNRVTCIIVCYIYYRYLYILISKEEQHQSGIIHPSIYQMNKAFYANSLVHIQPARFSFYSLAVRHLIYYEEREASSYMCLKFDVPYPNSAVCNLPTKYSY
jgi:hypothetical protein